MRDETYDEVSYKIYLDSHQGSYSFYRGDGEVGGKDSDFLVYFSVHNMDQMV